MPYSITAGPAHSILRQIITYLARHQPHTRTCRQPGVVSGRKFQASTRHVQCGLYPGAAVPMNGALNSTLTLLSLRLPGRGAGCWCPAANSNATGDEFCHAGLLLQTHTEAAIERAIDELLLQQQMLSMQSSRVYRLCLACCIITGLIGSPSGLQEQERGARYYTAGSDTAIAACALATYIAAQWWIRRSPGPAPARPAASAPGRAPGQSLWRSRRWSHGQRRG